MFFVVLATGIFFYQKNNHNGVSASTTLEGDVFYQQLDKIKGTDINVAKNSLIITPNEDIIAGETGEEKVVWKLSGYKVSAELKWENIKSKMNANIDRLKKERIKDKYIKISAWNPMTFKKEPVRFCSIIKHSGKINPDNNPDGQVWLIKNGDLIVDCNIQVEGKGTFIIEGGNLIIDNDINYATSDSSIGFIVENGNVKIKNSVYNLRGFYYVPKGTIEIVE